MGTVLDHLHGGSFDDAENADTIAAAIQRALVEVRREAGITQPLPSGDNAQQMNILFAAIGRGLLNHLRKHHQAIQVTVKDSLITLDGYVSEIDIKEK
jgi:hypothetical protein